MAAKFTKFQIAVNVYAFSDKYSDVASSGIFWSFEVYYYPSFQSSVHGEKLKHELTRDLTRDLTRETTWEAVMRIRCGKGVRFTSYHRNIMLRSTDLLALPAVDYDKAFAMLMSLEETLLTTQTEDVHEFTTWLIHFIMWRTAHKSTHSCSPSGC